MRFKFAVSKGAYKTRNIVLLLSGKLVSIFGTKIYNFALSYYILYTTGSSLAFGLSIALTSLPRAVLFPFAGIFSDKFNRKKLVVYSDILSGILMFSFFVLSLISELQISFIYLFTLLLSIFNTIFEVSLDSSIPGIVGTKNLKKVNSLSQSISSSSDILAPILGGIIFSIVDVKYFILANGISFLLAAVSESLIAFGDINITNSIDTTKNVLKELREGINYIKSVDFLYMLFIFNIFLNFFFHFGYGVGLPYIATNILKLSSWQFGVVRGTLSIGMLLTSIILPFIKNNTQLKRQYPTYAINGLSFALILLGCVGTPFLLTINKNILFLFFLVISFLLGIFAVLVNIPVMVMVQEITENRYLGRVIGLIKSTANILLPVAVLISGFLINIVKAPIIPITSGISLLAVSIILSKYQKK